MYRFWDAIIEPALDRLEPKVIVEIGADFGFNTRNLLDFARRTGATLHVIDPLPKFDVDEWAATYPGTLLFHGAPSLEVLSSIAQPDVVLIDGDHNWHTVFHELEALQDSADTESTGYPLVLLHDLGWPYGRRDLYYEPGRIPEPHRQPYQKGGLRPGRDSLDPHGGLNAHLFNAVRAGGPRNGVLTAVQDFVREAPFDLRLVVVPGINDLGILFSADLASRNESLSAFIDELAGGASLHRLLARVEALRIDAQIESLDFKKTLDEMRAHASQLDSRIEDLQSRITERDGTLSQFRHEMASNLEKWQQELRESDQEITRLEILQRDLRKSLIERDSRLRDEGDRAKALERDLKTAKQAHRDALRDYRRLKGRRSVRLALGLARFFRPLFRWRRGQGRPKTSAPAGRQDPGEQVSQPKLLSEREENLNLSPGVHLHGSEQTSGAPETITVIVPIYNAYEELRKCIDSLIRNTHYPAQLLLIDDASTDSRIAPFLAEVEERTCNVRVLTNERNLGFVATANRGFAESDGDVVLLNSDVEAVPGWLRRLALAAKSNPRAATVTPLSNNAGAFSAPKPGEASSVPPSLTRDEIGRLVAQRALRRYPEAPTGSGFCMLIRRQALDECGYFDEEAFPRGYGEENDFCMRALRAGWSHVVDDATYMFHERSSSFGAEKELLTENARRTIDERYPEYTGLVREFLSSESMTAAVDAVGSAFDEVQYGQTVRPRLLTVIHGGGGGTPATNLDLMRALSDRYDPFQLSCDARRLSLEKYANGKLEPVDVWPLKTRVEPTDVTRRDYRAIVGRILRDFDIEVVHIRHLIGHTFDLPNVAKSFGIPVVLSFHDFYYVCPTVHLLDNEQRFCRGQCTPGQGTCLIPTAWLNKVPHLKHAWVYQWRDRVSEMFNDVDAFVTASASAKEIYLSAFPQLEHRIRLIEHGRNVARHDNQRAATPSLHRPVRILVPGNLDYHKGADLLRAIKEHDTDGRLQFHFVGWAGDQYEELGVHHGRYNRDDWFGLVRRINPSFVGLFSVTAETFSHTLSEAWLAGLPVIATDRGAFKDRIERDGGGWLVDPDDPKKAYDQIRAIVDDRISFQEQLAHIPIAALRTAEQMAADYDSLYKSVQAERGPFDDGPDKSSPIRVGLFLLGTPAARPASTYIRVLRRYMHPSLTRTIVPILLDPSQYVETADRVDIDIALVQRTAIPTDLTDRFIDILRERDVPLLLDLDDDILSIAPDHADFAYYEPFFASIRSLIEASTTVTVSTESLRREIGLINPNTIVIENHLDEHLWFSPIKPIAASSRPAEDDRLRLLYFGSLTHGEDLRILRTAIRGLEGQVAVTVVGGAPNGSIGWAQQLVPDRSWNQYPDFVRWLRRNVSEFDAAAIPLANTAFNEAKSDLKFLEVASLGVPVICSRVKPYTNTVVDGETGLLVDNDPAAWREAILKLRSDPNLRSRLASAAFDYVRGQRLLVQHVDRLRGILDGVLSSNRESDQAARRTPVVTADT